MCVGRCAGLSLLRLLNAAHSHAGEKATGIYTALMAAPGGACSVSAPRESIRARGDRKPPGASLKASSNLGAAGRTTAPPESACRSPWLMRRREGALSDGLAKRARSTWPRGSECVPLKVPKLKS